MDNIHHLHYETLSLEAFLLVLAYTKYQRGTTPKNYFLEVAPTSALKV